jgi:hypothetical protein
MDGVCATCGGEEKWMQGLSGETWREAITWKTMRRWKDYINRTAK